MCAKLAESCCTRRAFTGIGGCFRGLWRCVSLLEPVADANGCRAEGVAGFYRGLGANSIRMIPTGAIQHVAYSFFKNLLACDP